MNHTCTCLIGNKKAGKEIYSCNVCKKPEPVKSRQERLNLWIAKVVEKSKGMYSDQILKEAIDKFNKANPI